MEYSKEELEKAIIDLLDGNSRPHEIYHQTGLQMERCEQLTRMYINLIKKHIG